jgi:hypothetical protein
MSIALPGPALTGCIHAVGTGPYDPFKLWTPIAGPLHTTDKAPKTVLMPLQSTTKHANLDDLLGSDPSDLYFVYGTM